MRKALRWVVPALFLLVVAAVALIIVGAVAGGPRHKTGSSATSPVVAASPPRTHTNVARRHLKPRRAVTARLPMSRRCGDIAVNQYASCAFARVVVTEYDAKPSSSFLARSPVTGLIYTMHCAQARGVVTCDDNSTSRLAFNGPPPASSTAP
jgi:hypothetical protein